MIFCLSGFLNTASGFIITCKSRRWTLQSPQVLGIAPCNLPAPCHNRSSPEPWARVCWTQHTNTSMREDVPMHHVLFGWDWFSSPSPPAKQEPNRSMKGQPRSCCWKILQFCKAAESLRTYPGVGKKASAFSSATKGFAWGLPQQGNTLLMMPRQMWRYNLKKTDYNPTLLKANSREKLRQ